ncbi:hypothetical protein OHS33_38945 (plasmid) [Streptomyces sp. NBC_00536]|uniref:hypothetical protein n=1 Tax=Streptomyces sp. NBC_00536 TaxID=2975769 RepID=UPI002E814F9C|nr:hypothetical protein [Streptomyces sp. NBC_00536]WUC84336.1 hypothetical protein OHS33_38945 [Streptomyces sp. NBC_00536]
MSSSSFPTLLIVAEVMHNGRMWRSQAGMDPVHWNAFPDLRSMKVGYVMHHLQSRLGPVEESDVRVFLWDGKRETPLPQDLFSVSADQRR